MNSYGNCYICPTDRGFETRVEDIELIDNRVDDLELDGEVGKQAFYMYSIHFAFLQFPIFAGLLRTYFTKRIFFSLIP